MKQLLLFSLMLMILAGCNASDHSTNNLTSKQQSTDMHTRISKITTDLEVKDNWLVVPEGVRTMTIHVEADHTETVLFWLAPTGTETGKEKILLGYDTDGSDGWSFEWEFGDAVLHDHISIQALGVDDKTQATETLNIHSL